MTLEYSYLDEVYGVDTIKNIKNKHDDLKIMINEIRKNDCSTKIDDLPEYKELPKDLQFYHDIKPGKKLRVVNDVFQIDNRKLQAIKRRVSGDSREKTLRYFETIYYKYKASEFHETVKEIMKFLYQTYSTDDKFITKLNKLNDTMHK